MATPETNPDYFGYSIFCDDIRNEVGGKLSLIGTYTGQMWVHQTFPVTIPKFGISVVWYEKMSIPHVQTKLRVTIGDDPSVTLLENTIPYDEAIAAAPPTSNLPEPEYLIVTSAIILSPLVVVKPSALRVRAYRGDQEVKIGSLRIEAGTTEKS